MHCLIWYLANALMIPILGSILMRCPPQNRMKPIPIDKPGKSNHAEFLPFLLILEKIKIKILHLRLFCAPNSLYWLNYDYNNKNFCCLYVHKH